jgi:7,8-dihydropterin-6-yl-methyl-4-(beta-D-ribofuranosyl)aminobenzene 5'-phosphate synthase
MAEGGGLGADAYRDDVSLVLLWGDRLALLCGCCRAGLLNTLAHVERLFPQPVALIAAGLHLASPTDTDVRRAVARLAAMQTLRRVSPVHCSGEAAFLSLAQALGQAVVHPSSAGTVIDLDATASR